MSKLVLSRQPCPSCSSSDALLLHRECNKKYFQKNRKVIQERRKTYYRDNPEICMLRRAKDRSAKLGLPFNITLEDIKIPKICPVLGIELKQSENLASRNSPSIDRIKSNLGYVKENVRVISLRANNLKSDMTLEEARLILKDLELVQT